MSTYPELSGKVTVISGAGGNLGFAVARRFQAEGVKLALMDRNEDKLRQNLRDANIDDSSIFIAPADLTKKDQVDQFMDRVVSTFGQVDVLVHTAGGYRPGAKLYEMTEDQWNGLIDLNAKTTFLLNAAAARCMVDKGNKGRIVNVAGRAALSGGSTIAAYSAAKAAVLRITESLAAELLKKDITVNAVLPSTIDTPQNRAGDPQADFSRWVKPESIADVIAFLASDGARDISGAAIPVYGKA